MASIYRRENGKWIALIRKARGQSLAKTFIRKSDADAWAKKVESAMERGIWKDTESAETTTLSQAFDLYKPISAKKKSASKESSLIRIWQSLPIAQKALARITSADFYQIMRQWENAGLAPATIRRRLLLVSHVFATARKEWGIVVDNPIATVSKPKVQDAREVILTSQQITTICQNTESTHLADIVQIALETAMRLSEIVGLRWIDIDLGHSIATLEDTKNGSKREVPLSSCAKKILQRLKKGSRNAKDAVFPITSSGISHAWIKACKRAGLENLRFHDLRHTATTRLGQIFAMHDLAKITGHKDPRMLMRYYNPKMSDLAKKLR